MGSLFGKKLMKNTAFPSFLLETTKESFFIFLIPINLVGAMGYTV